MCTGELNLENLKREKLDSLLFLFSFLNYRKDIKSKK